MKTIPATVLTQMQAQQKAPVSLFELALDTGALRFAAAKIDVVFPTAGNTYTAKAVLYNSVSQSTEGEIARVNVRFDNVSKDMAAWANSTPFRGRELVIKKVYRAALGDASYYEIVFAGKMTQPKFDRQWMTVEAKRDSAFVKCLTDIYQRNCPLLFGGARCNTDGNADITTTPLKVTGTADSGDTTHLVDDALTQANDFWNYGKITVVHDPGGTPVTETRKVLDFVAASDQLEVDVAFSFSVTVGDTYTLIGGCDKTWDCCSGTKAFGPTADNKLNYGGFLHIGDLPEVADPILDRKEAVVRPPRLWTSPRW